MIVNRAVLSFIYDMGTPELCKELLHRILPDLDIDHIEYPELQKEIKEDMEAKSIRLDVYVKGSNDIIYNIEMQAADTKELPKRSRYYQAMIDLQLLDKGDKSYNELNKTYIIFICLFDLFGQERHIYTFENFCKEDASLAMGDEATKIFLNAKGVMNDVSDELKAFLDYVAGRKPKDEFVDKLEEAVQKAKKNREWSHDYMTLMMREKITYENGKEYGIGIGEIRGTIKTYKRMNVPDDIIIENLQDIYNLSEQEAEEYLRNI